MSTENKSTKELTYDEAQQELEQIIELFTQKAPMEDLLKIISRAKEVETILRDKITAREQVVKEYFGKQS